MRFVQSEITNDLYVRLKLYGLKSSKSVTSILTSAIIYYLDLKEQEASALKKSEGTTNSKPLQKVRAKSFASAGESDS
jgi:hypothetical protein